MAPTAAPPADATLAVAGAAAGDSAALIDAFLRGRRRARVAGEAAPSPNAGDAAGPRAAGGAPDDRTFRVEAAPGALGLALEITPVGAVVRALHPTCGYRDRIRVGDVILGVDGRRVSRVEDLRAEEGRRRLLTILAAPAAPAVMIGRDGHFLPPAAMAVGAAAAAGDAGARKRKHTEVGNGVAQMAGKCTGSQCAAQSAHDATGPNETESEEDGSEEELAQTRARLRELEGLLAPYCRRRQAENAQLERLLSCITETQAEEEVAHTRVWMRELEGLLAPHCRRLRAENVPSERRSDSSGERVCQKCSASKETERRDKSTVRQCSGVYDGYFGSALYFAGKSMLNTGRRLLEWSRESDAGVSSFKGSALAGSTEVLLPFYGMTVRKADEGFAFFRANCEGEGRKRTCEICARARKGSRQNISAMFRPAVRAAGVNVNTRIDHIANDPEKAKIEITALREKVALLTKTSTGE